MTTNKNYFEFVPTVLEDGEKHETEAEFKVEGYDSDIQLVASITSASSGNLALGVVVFNNWAYEVFNCLLSLGNASKIQKGADKLIYKIDGEYLYISTEGFEINHYIQIKNQQDEKGLFFDEFDKEWDEHIESMGYRDEEDILGEEAYELKYCS